MVWRQGDGKPRYPHAGSGNRQALSGSFRDTAGYKQKCFHTWIRGLKNPLHQVVRRKWPSQMSNAASCNVLNTALALWELSDNSSLFLSFSWWCLSVLELSLDSPFCRVCSSSSKILILSSKSLGMLYLDLCICVCICVRTRACACTGQRLMSGCVPPSLVTKAVWGNDLSRNEFSYTSEFQRPSSHHQLSANITSS